MIGYCTRRQVTLACGAAGQQKAAYADVAVMCRRFRAVAGLEVEEEGGGEGGGLWW